MIKLCFSHENFHFLCRYAQCVASFIQQIFSLKNFKIMLSLISVTTILNRNIHWIITLNSCHILWAIFETRREFFYFLIFISFLENFVLNRRNNCFLLKRIKLNTFKMNLTEFIGFHCLCFCINLFG